MAPKVISANRVYRTSRTPCILRAGPTRMRERQNCGTICTVPPKVGGEAGSRTPHAIRLPLCEFTSTIFPLQPLLSELEDKNLRPAAGRSHFLARSSDAKAEMAAYPKFSTLMRVDGDAVLRDCWARLRVGAGRIRPTCEPLRDGFGC